MLEQMKRIFLGRSDLSVSQICLGTMTFGQQNSEAEAHAQLNFALSQGINFIDTAEMYPVPALSETTGLTERYVGSWLKRQPRDQIVLATKATGPGRTLTWIREGNLSFNRANLQRALEGSLKRLQTDYIDLYQLHWPDRNAPIFGNYHFHPEQERETVPLQETLSVLADFIKDGKIRHWGLVKRNAVGRADGSPSCRRAGSSAACFSAERLQPAQPNVGEWLGRNRLPRKNQPACLFAPWVWSVVGKIPAQPKGVGAREPVRWICRPVQQTQYSCRRGCLCRPRATAWTEALSNLRWASTIAGGASAARLSGRQQWSSYRKIYQPRK